MESTEIEQVHAHEVMKTLLARGQAYTREGLTDAIRKHFGEQARFETCSTKGMSAHELVLFLIHRRKLAQSGDSFQLAAAGSCSH